MSSLMLQVHEDDQEDLGETLGCGGGGQRSTDRVISSVSGEY